MSNVSGFRHVGISAGIPADLGSECLLIGLNRQRV